MKTKESPKWTVKEEIAHLRIRIALGNAGPIRKARMQRKINDLEREVQTIELEEVLVK